MSFDVIIIGSGLAGMAAALELAPHRRVALVSKGALLAGASAHAQGGIAAPLGPGDSVADHLRDTLDAGAGLCDANAARAIIDQACAAIAWLQAQGVAFSMDGAGLHLTREGGHGQRRIAHAADATGRAIMAALGAQVRRQAAITVLERHCAVKLLLPAPPGARCQGVRLLDLDRRLQRDVAANHVVIASGGAGQVYATTTAPPGATGDGIALAARAGARTANLAFTQFHPTGLHHPRGGGFLISEAVRGEGGRLCLPDGSRFMPAHDPRAELAPRDIVARAIHAEMRRHALDCVYLDISHRPRDFLLAHFPAIHAHCLALGLDITTTPIPVAPTAHYTCGGIATDTRGRSSVAGLYAVGEAACTGLHGANRLASNSLLECVVTGRAAARDILAGSVAKRAEVPAQADAIPACASPAHDASATAFAAPLRQSLRAMMSREVGIVRSDASLQRAANHIAGLRRMLADRGHADSNVETLELNNLVLVADLMMRDARARRESRGAHFNQDWPDRSAEPPGMAVPQRAGASGR
ncbi:L-aspartate oxidase [Achromobacter ruhlandii]|uniref:L-aspartate oxidase n=1 Tax=Achromobacter ruhlandii TaxID=72557 RepID=UPI001468BBDC|nr:L-aspartate oxidase [Achromobacter ruhlandii]CAB3926926.1 L-aspartate oxidase [Achromobacter ruhlandii]